jgi:hypothetical protein
MLSFRYAEAYFDFLVVALGKELLKHCCNSQNLFLSCNADSEIILGIPRDGAGKPRKQRTF